MLFRSIETALAAGAKRVTLCDTAGVLLPEEFAAFLTRVRQGAPALDGAQLMVQVSDSMSVGVACAAAAIAGGAEGVKCAAVGGGIPSLLQMSKLIQVKGADLDIACNLRTTELERAVNQMERMLSPQIGRAHV